MMKSRYRKKFQPASIASTITDILGAGFYSLAWLFMTLISIIMCICGIYAFLQMPSNLNLPTTIMLVLMTVIITAVWIVAGLFLRWLAKGIVNRIPFRIALAALTSTAYGVMMLASHHYTSVAEFYSNLDIYTFICAIWLWYISIRYLVAYYKERNHGRSEITR